MKIINQIKQIAALFIVKLIHTPITEQLGLSIVKQLDKNKFVKHLKKMGFTKKQARALYNDENVIKYPILNSNESERNYYMKSYIDLTNRIKSNKAVLIKLDERLQQYINNIRADKL